MDICNNQEEIAEELFYGVGWQSPCTLMNDWEVAGEIDTCENYGIQCEEMSALWG